MTDHKAVTAGPAVTKHGGEPRIAYLIRRLQYLIKEEMDARLGPLGLTTRQYTALSILRYRDGLSNAQLARRCLVSPQAMGELVTELERSGLVRRSPHPTSGRVRHIMLTSAGERAMEDADRAADEVENQMLGELTAADRSRLRAWLESSVRGLGAGIG